MFFFKAPDSWGFSTSRVEDYLKQSKIKDLATSKAWLRLGHYKKNIFGEWQSALRGNFFLAPDGYKNPAAELDETLKSFFKDGPEETHAQCRYLARFEWLKQNLTIHPDDVFSCKEKEEWKKKFDATGVSLIFASADTASAASIYGHTFIKIIGRNQEHDRDLLNYGVNYAARATDQEGLFYALKGLFGFYQGGYAMLPYHEKIREYVNVEGRDIWEYRLNINQKQLNQLINHLLELTDSWSPYYFAWDNCSYQLLSLLEVANEDLDLVSKFNFFVIPLDTIKVVSRSPGLVTHKKIRRSLKKDFTENYSQLSRSQKSTVKRLIESENLQLDDSFSKTEKAAVLDSAMKLYSLKSYQDGTEYKEEKYKLMIARSQYGPSDETTQTKPRSPDETHDSSGVYFGAGQEQNRDFASFKIRTAFHDLISPDESLFEFSHNEVLSADIRYFANPYQLDLQNFTLVDLLTSRAISDLEQPLSWKIQVYTEPKLSPHLQTGFGYSVDFSMLNKSRFIGLVGAQLEKSRVGIGPDLFFIYRLHDCLGIMTNYRGSWNNKDYFSHWNVQMGIPLSQQMEFRLEFKQNEKFENEWQARILKQFIL
ncbi:MAG: DUF4105 domain-containing protein [Pseudobdellovibrionaceae bacterium]|jgi:hypothetical protein